MKELLRIRVGLEEENFRRVANSCTEKGCAGCDKEVSRKRLWERTKALELNFTTNVGSLYIRLLSKTYYSCLNAKNIVLILFLKWTFC